jgi:hypothetical protein
LVWCLQVSVENPSSSIIGFVDVSMSITSQLHLTPHYW